MNASLIFVLAAAMVACPPAPAGAVGSAVTMELCTDQGGVLPLYPVAAPAGSRKAYAEAVPGARYGIRVRNNLGCRVGLVIAVDGRNIISGSQSWLGGGERMYVLAPGEVQEFRGWRTAQDKENRFYFTSVADSYAAAFGDTSAMGVVAMAVYREVPPPPPPPAATCAPSLQEGAPAPQPEMARRSRAKSLDAAGAAGTGYGEEVYSPSFNVAFDPESRPWEKSFIKYEWRETLVRLGVIRPPAPPTPPNRLWDSGFAPPPPRS
jgi:hypothetical protein